MANYSDSPHAQRSDDFLPSAYKKLHGIIRKDSSVTTSKLGQDNYFVSKELEHKKASTETQLVLVKTNKTMEGKVDLKKIADIRRSIRRRYTNRTDFRKIFNAWDYEGLGVLRPEDVHRMVNRLAVDINMDEAKVLIATANKSMTGVLSLAEFMELIFDESDKINVDLSSIGDAETPQIQDTYYRSLQELALNQHTKKMQASLIFHIKDHLVDVSASLTKADKRRSGIVNFDSFCDVMNNMSLPHTFSNEKYWKILYNELGGGPDGIDYASFVDQVKSFEILEPASEAVSPTKKLATSASANLLLDVTRPKTELRPILDKRRLPINKLEGIMKTLIPLKVKIAKLHPSENELRKALAKYAEGSAISSAKLREFLLSVEPDIFLNEASHFLSSFNYNPDGYTDVADVVLQVLSSEDKGYIELQRYNRVAPPRSHRGVSEESRDVRRLLRDMDQKLIWGHDSFKAFKRIDADRDGFISAKDLRLSLKKVNLDLSERDATAIMDEIDAGNKGYLSYQRFAKQMSTPLLNRSRDTWETRESNMQPSTSFLQGLHSYRSSHEYYTGLISSLRPSRDPVSETVVLPRPI